MFKVNADTQHISVPAKVAEKSGEKNQLANIKPTLFQLRLAALEPTIPAPSIAPTAVCVPEIGIPDIDEVIMKMNEATQIANIIRCFTKISSSSRSLIILFFRVVATLLERNIAPRNSAVPPQAKIAHTGKALVP